MGKVAEAPGGAARYRAGHRHRPIRLPSLADASNAFWVLAAFLLLLFFTGGSSRPDVTALMVLRPASVLFFAYGLFTLRPAHIAAHKPLFWFAGSLVALTVLHLVPLPPALWHMLPGRDLIARIDAAAGIASAWRPISMAPAFTWNALYALIVPLTVLVLGAQIGKAEHKRIIVFVIVLAIVWQLLSLLQMLEGENSYLYFYPGSISGIPTGPFANRNHFAIFLAALFPILGYFAATRDHGPSARRQFLAGLAGLLALVLILVSGSRAGLLGGAIALAMLPAVMLREKGKRRPSRLKISRPALIAVAGALIVVALVVGWIMISGRAASIQHAFDSDPTQDPRLKIWPVVIAHFGDFFPFGSGIGSYERVFQTIEPDILLRSTYSNHAHNDWLEILFTAGLPGIALLLWATVMTALAAWRVMRAVPLDDIRLARTGIIIIGVLALGSAADYPLRVPILAALFVEACFWVGIGLKARRLAASNVPVDHSL